MKKTDKENEVSGEEVRNEYVERSESVKQAEAEVQQEETAHEISKEEFMEALFGKQPKDLHEYLLSSAIQENQEKLLGCAKAEIMKAQVQRKHLVREMERIDAQISGIDKRCELLAKAIEDGDIIESSEVHAFMNNGGFVHIAVVDVENTSFGGPQPKSAATLRTSKSPRI